MAHLLIAAVFFHPLALVAADSETEEELTADAAISDLCQQISRKLASVGMQECLDLELQPSGHFSVNGLPIAVHEYAPVEGRQPLGKVLFVAGLHGDEYSSISVTIKWMHTLSKYHSGLFHWRVAPLANPDGLLRRKSQRMNGAGIDLNRNFPTSSWRQALVDYWEVRTGRNKRRYPGPYALSEPESRWLFTEIVEFEPDVVVSVHAPHGIVDFDGPRKVAPQRLGHLSLKLLGTYPGSLGNFSSMLGELPVVTLELPHAGIMPSRQQISHIWTDLVRWLKKNIQWKKEQKMIDLEVRHPLPS